MSIINAQTTVHYNRIPSIITALESMDGNASHNAAEMIQARAKRAAPVRTGHMRDSIDIEKITVGKWRVKVGAEYAGFVEFGTRNMAPQPFFTPAVEYVRAYFVSDVIDRLREIARHT